MHFWCLCLLSVSLFTISYSFQMFSIEERKKKLNEQWNGKTKYRMKNAKLYKCIKYPYFAFQKEKMVTKKIK